MNQNLRLVFNGRPLFRLGSASLLMCSLAGWLRADDGKWKEQEPMPDKSRYHLFNLTPREHMREMSTDRPDKTESAYTVDAGHFQFEMNLLSYTHDRDKSEDIQLDAGVNIGVTKSADDVNPFVGLSWRF